MITRNKLLNNFLSLSFGEIVSKLLAFGAVVYLARILGVEGYGTIDFIVCILSFFLLAVNCGFDIFGIREISRDKDQAKKYVSNIITIRLILAIICYLIITGIIIFLPKSLEFKKIFFLYGLTLFPFAFNLKWLFIALEKTKLVSLCLIFNQVIFIFCVILLISNRNQLIQIPLIQLGAEGFVALGLIAVFVKQSGCFVLQIDLSFWKEILKQSLPLCLALVVSQLNYHFDIIMIGIIKNEEFVGWYSAAYKILIFFVVMNATYFTVILPTVSRFYNRNLNELKGHMARSIKFTSLIAIPIGFGGTLLAKPIINMIYGIQYTNSIIVFQLLIWSIPIHIIRANYRVLLIGLNKQTLDLKSISYGLAVNVTLNLILIPIYGLLGAIIATISSGMVALFLAHRYVNKHLVNVPFMTHLFKPVFSASIMSVVLYAVKGMPLFVSLPIGVCTYFIVLFLIKGITREDIKLVLQET